MKEAWLMKQFENVIVYTVLLFRIKPAKSSSVLEDNTDNNDGATPISGVFASFML